MVATARIALTLVHVRGEERRSRSGRQVNADERRKLRRGCARAAETVESTPPAGNVLSLSPMRVSYNLAL